MTGDGENKDECTEQHRPKLAEQREVETVYQPAEDSRLLADTVVDRIESDAFVLDVGTGSGFLAHRIREQTGARALGSDINPDACRQASDAGVPVVRANLFDPFQAESFDVVVCNPPYLPTPPGQEWDDWMERALSGGEDGRAMVDPFIAGVGRVLAPGGRAYLLASTLTGPEAIRSAGREQGFEVAVIAEESYPFERLLVFEFILSVENPGGFSPASI